MIRPPKRKPAKGRLGIGNKHRLVYRQHQQWIRGFDCIVPNCRTFSKIICAHVRNGHPEGTPQWERGSTQQKPHDRWTVPMCWSHHLEQGDTGEGAFCEKYGIDMIATATKLAARSPYSKLWRESHADHD